LEEELDATRVSLEDALERADFLSLHVPLTDTTRHLIDARALAMMQPHAILINTSRGGVIDEQALIEALKARKIAGAGLDVYEHEPFVSEALKNLKKRRPYAPHRLCNFRGAQAYGAFGKPKHSGRPQRRDSGILREPCRALA